MDRKVARHYHQNTGAHAAPSRGRRVLSIADDPKPSRATEPALRRLYIQIKNLASY